MTSGEGSNAKADVGREGQLSVVQFGGQGPTSEFRRTVRLSTSLRCDTRRTQRWSCSRSPSIRCSNFSFLQVIPMQDNLLQNLQTKGRIRSDPCGVLLDSDGPFGYKSEFDQLHYLLPSRSFLPCALGGFRPSPGSYSLLGHPSPRKENARERASNVAVSAGLKS